MRRLLARCLERDGKTRLRDIGDARLELDDAPDTTGRAKFEGGRSLWRVLPWGSVGRDGAALALDLPGGSYTNPRISPDGRRLLVENGGNFIEALDLARGTRARLTSSAFGTLMSTWTADGNRVVFRRFNSPC